MDPPQAPRCVNRGFRVCKSLGGPRKGANDRAQKCERGHSKVALSHARDRLGLAGSACPARQPLRRMRSMSATTSLRATRVHREHEHVTGACPCECGAHGVDLRQPHGKRDSA